MSFNMEDMTDDELEFYTSKGDVSKEHILKHLNNGLSFSDAVITEAAESLVSYYNWVKNNVKDEDKSKVSEWDSRHETNYTGGNLTEYEKTLFDTLPNVGKWQVGNYSRMWRGLEEADECLVEFIYHEVNYLGNPTNN